MSESRRRSLWSRSPGSNGEVPSQLAEKGAFAVGTDGDAIDAIVMSQQGMQMASAAYFKNLENRLCRSSNFKVVGAFGRLFHCGHSWLADRLELLASLGALGEVVVAELFDEALDLPASMLWVDLSRAAQWPAKT